MKTKKQIFVRYFLIMAALEVPLLLWFNAVQADMHRSVIPILLFMFHLPSYYLMRAVLIPFESSLSMGMFNLIGLVTMGAIQAALISGAMGLIKGRLRKGASE